VVSPFEALTPREVATWGVFFASLLEDPSWVGRRVETIRLLDRSRVERRISLDVDFDDVRARVHEAGLPASALQDLPLPVAFLRKQLLFDLDVSDGGGQSLSVATSDVDAAASGSLILAVAAREAGEAISWRMPAWRRAWTEVATQVAIVTRAADAPPSPLVAPESFSDEANALWRRLFRAGPAAGLLRDFADQYQLMVYVDATGPWRHRVLKFTTVDALRYEERLRSLNRIGLAPAILDVPLSGIGSAAREHTRVIAPEGTTVTGVAWDPEASEKPLIEGESVRLAGIEDRGVAYTRGLPARPYSLRISLEVSRGIFFFPAAIVSWFMVALLIGAVTLQATDCRFSDDGLLTGRLLDLGQVSFFRIEGPDGASVDGFVAVLALVPTLIVAYLVRPNEHAFVGSLMTLPRVLLTAAAFSVTAAGAVAAVSVEARVLQGFFMGALAVALISALVNTSAAFRIGAAVRRWRREKDSLH
jgi:hypothetical protein